MKVNGKHLKIETSTLTEFLCSHGYDEKRIAVELNGKIVPRKEYVSEVIRDEDVLEIMGFVGGG